MPGSLDSRKSNFIICLLLAISSNCLAQGYLEPASLNYDLMPLHEKNSTVDKNFYSNSLELKGIAPVFLKKDSSQYLIAGIDFQYINFAGTHPDFPVSNVVAIDPILGYTIRASRRLYLSAIFVPLLNSDLVKVTGSDVHLGGFLRVSYRFNDNLVVKPAAGVVMQYYGLQYIALLGFDWKISDKWRAFGDFPINAALRYSFSKKVYAGLTYVGLSTSYNLPDQNAYFEYTYAELGIFAEYYLSRLIALRATVGYPLKRNMELYNSNYKTGSTMYIDTGPETTALNRKMDDGLMYRLSLCLRLPEPNKK